MSQHFTNFLSLSLDLIPQFGTKYIFKSIKKYLFRFKRASTAAVLKTAGSRSDDNAWIRPTAATQTDNEDDRRGDNNDSEDPEPVLLSMPDYLEGVEKRIVKEEVDSGLEDATVEANAGPLARTENHEQITDDIQQLDLELVSGMNTDF